MKLILILLFSFLTAPLKAQGLHSFKTDYCTNYPEGTLSAPSLWKHCCLLHDLYFWAGGTKENRNTVDKELRSCIEATGAEKIARLMYWAVRLGSQSPVKYPDKKWNNGWKDRSDFQKLTSEDITLIEDEIFSKYDFILESQKQFFIQQLRSRLD